MTSSGLLAFSNGARPAPKAFCASSTESFTSIAKTGWRPTTVNRPAIAQMATPPIRVADVRHRTLMTPSVYKTKIDGAALYGTPYPFAISLRNEPS